MSLPLVSCIVPVYNVAGFIDECLASLIGQTYPHLEILVVDDCSPDDSMTHVHSMQDARIRVLTHAQNRGLAAARNTALQAAQGKYVCSLDSDDFFDLDSVHA